jgi:two-component system, chemotaxis family, sensor kinase CheA
VDELTREFIAESQEGLERMELCLTELEKRPNDAELVAEIFRTVHTIKGTTGFLGFSRLQTLAHTGESVLVALRERKIGVTPELISGLLSLLDRLREILRLIEETGTEGERVTDDDEGLNVHLVQLRTRDADLLAQASLAPAHCIAEPAAGVQVSAEVSLSQRRTLRIDVDVLNRMMNQVGELVLTRNHILQSGPGAENFAELARRLNNVTGELRQSVMQARMQPAGHLFGKFPRMVRDLARACGRRVRIEFEGQETELDKSLLEAIRDPLTHAVRNAVDHGIEPPEERVRAGKPAEGLVRLRAFHEGGSVVMEVTDDGAGIATERVLAEAMERGLITPERAATISPHEALQIIFVEGFSTATEVTSVSGRGVGMDVVRANLEKVGGNVEVESREGWGTTVRMRVPLTLAIISALVVRSGGQSFVLPQSALVELVYVPRRDRESVVERVGGADLYRLRESLLPLVWLDRVLGLETDAKGEARDVYVAVLEAAGRRFGLVVDDLRAPEEIVVKPLSAVLREIGMFSGATVLGNGSLALILDVAAMGARAGVRPAADAVATASGAQIAQDLRAMSGPESSMVVFETWRRDGGGMDRGARMALPLSAVERIERVPLNEVEWADGRAVLQYGGELLPLEDVEGAFAALEGVGAKHAGAMATIVICLRPGVQPRRRVGMVVRRVLDVSEATPLAVNADLPGSPLAMVKSRVTTVHRDFAGQLELPEVA